MPSKEESSGLHYIYRTCRKNKYTVQSNEVKESETVKQNGTTIKKKILGIKSLIQEFENYTRERSPAIVPFYPSKSEARHRKKR